jgi:hypothetical protein
VEKSGLVEINEQTIKEQVQQIKDEAAKYQKLNEEKTTTMEDKRSLERDFENL